MPSTFEEMRREGVGRGWDLMGQAEIAVRYTLRVNSERPALKRCCRKISTCSMKGMFSAPVCEYPPL